MGRLSARVALTACVVLLLQPHAILGSSPPVVPASVPIAVLMPQSGPRADNCSASAVAMALREVAASAEILPDTRLVASWHDTVGQEATSVIAALSALCQHAGVDAVRHRRGTEGLGVFASNRSVCGASPCVPATAILGAYWSFNSLEISRLATYFDIPVLSPASEATSLTDDAIFPTFSRVVSSDFGTSGYVAVLKHFGWSRINLVRSQREPYASLANSFAEYCDDAGVYVDLNLPFDLRLSEAEEDLTHNLELLSTSETYVIVMFGWEDDLAYILQRGKEFGLNKSPFLVVVTTEFVNQTNIDELPAGSLVIDRNYFDRSQDAFVTFKREWYSQSRGDMCATYADEEQPDLWSAFAYDSLWLLARAIHKVIYETVDGGDPATWTTAALVSAIRTTDMEGATGRVVMDRFGDRIMPCQLLQVIDNQILHIATLTSSGDWRTWAMDITATMFWPDGTQNVPSDRPVVLPWSMSPVVRAVMYFLAAVTLLLVTVVVLGLIRFRHDKLIQWSQPLFCIIICVGFYLTAISAVINVATSDKHVTKVTCAAVTWLELLGATLTYGALLSKTYRVHKIFNNRKLKVRVAAIPPVFLLYLGSNCLQSFTPSRRCCCLLCVSALGAACCG